MRFTHEYDAKGNHRLLIQVGPGDPITTGDWNGYRAPAKASLEGWTYMAFTDYFSGDWVPDMVYAVQERGKAPTIQAEEVTE